MDERIKIITDWLGSGSINLFGKPFSGKDTQARALAEMLRGVLVGGGDILRSHADRQVGRTMSGGGIVPSELYLKLVTPYLARTEFKDKLLILDSVGRAHGEESTIVNAAAASGHHVKAAVLLNIPEGEVWRRFELSKVQGDRGERPDDSREALAVRLKKFQAETEPVIEFYRQQGLLIEINGELLPHDVTNEIILKLTQAAA